MTTASKPAARRGLTALVLILALAAAPPTAAGATRTPRPPDATGPAALDFRHFLESLRADAIREGIAPAVFDAATAGLTPDPAVLAMTRRQPEFAKPAGAYLAAQVTPARVAEARAALARWRDVLTPIAERTGVPAAILVAVWGLESAFGRSPGDKDVLRSILTLAAANYRPIYRDEALAALRLLQEGAVKRADLKGSWAGAMGQPQFLPSSFAAYAIDADGDGRRDIWRSVPDSLASIAAFLAAKGWQPGLPWGFEVRLPAGLDLGVSRRPFPDWAAQGVARTDGKPLPESGEGILFFPAGAAGPAFLVTVNFEVIKSYNFSDAYVLSVGELAAEMEGGPAFAGTWPADPPLSRPERVALQARLAARGLPVDNREGRISLALRDTIRQAQAAAGLVPDGNPTRALLDALPEQ